MQIELSNETVSRLSMILGQSSQDGLAGAIERVLSDDSFLNHLAGECLSDADVQAIDEGIADAKSEKTMLFDAFDKNFRIRNSIPTDGTAK